VVSRCGTALDSTFVSSKVQDFFFQHAQPRQSIVLFEDTQVSSPAPSAFKKGRSAAPRLSSGSFMRVQKASILSEDQENMHVDMPHHSQRSPKFSVPTN
jgi:hypothetical protein